MSDVSQFGDLRFLPIRRAVPRVSVDKHAERARTPVSERGLAPRENTAFLGASEVSLNTLSFRSTECKLTPVTVSCLLRHLSGSATPMPGRRAAGRAKPGVGR